METSDLADGLTRIVLDVDAADQPIRGWLRPETGPPQEFLGWLELTRALERMVSEAARRAAPSQDRRGS